MTTIAPPADNASDRDWANHVDAVQALAAEADCDYRIVGCDGAWHDGMAAPETWGHRVCVKTFETVEVEIGVSDPQVGFVAQFDVSQDIVSLTSGQCRSEAWAWRKYPHFIHKVADRVGGLNVSDQILRHMREQCYDLKDLADILNQSDTQTMKQLTGRRSWGIGQLGTLAAVFRCQPWEFLRAGAGA